MTDSPIAGWYPDPQDSASWRWWNGTDWTSDVVARPAPAEVRAEAAPRRPADWGWDNTVVVGTGGAATLAPGRPVREEKPARAGKAAPAPKPPKAEPPAKAPKAERPAKDTAPARAERVAPAERPARAARAERGASATTAWIWLLVFSPLIYGILVGALQQYVFPYFADQAQDTQLLVGIGTLVLPLVLLWVFAELDGRTLRKRGFEAPSVLWMLLLPPIAYFVRRWALLKRSGARSFAPALALFIVYALIVAAVVVQINAIIALFATLGVAFPAG